ncbi:MAG: PAS domain S-box protein [Burkholderiales bacterium]|nr:PAS domain S-box protein [Burkholderiales bacterium]
MAQRTNDLEREVAERERTESALRESEQRLRNILDHAPIGIVYTDLVGRIREANPALRQMVGYSAEDLARRSLQDLTHPDDRADDAQLLAHLLHGEIDQVRRRKRLQHQRGQDVWVQLNLSVLRDASAQPQRLVAVIEDITEHLRLQDAERARELAESANRAKSEFLSRMSHELRTPLNAMLGFAQLLDLDRRPVLAPHQTEWTAQIQHAGWHLLEMINDTLDLSRIEAGTLRLETRPTALAPLLEACVAMVEPTIGKRGITLHQHVDPQAQMVEADPTRLKQILTNLLSNAVKYNVDGGEVHISSALSLEGNMQISVSDTGPGLSDTQMDELFQPFNRLGQEHGSIEGTGIGLVISRRLAELMQGHLVAHSLPGRGSTFVLTLPHGRRTEAQSSAPEIDPLIDPSYRHRHVLYVEDNETNAEVMRGILAQRPQVRMEVCTSGLDGLAAVRTRHPDVILLDMHLPDIDGLELLRHLKDDMNTADIPVVVVSADATRARINDAIAAGAVRYLTKPLNIAEFLEAMDGLLAQLDTRFS